MKYLFLLLLPSLTFASPITTTNLLNTLNHDRAKIGVHAVSLDTKLMQKAQQRAVTLYDADQWSHDNWKLSFIGTKFASGYRGENLARNFDTTEETNQAWLDSLLHRQNIMNYRYTSVGIGIYKNYVVELFGGNL